MVDLIFRKNEDCEQFKMYMKRNFRQQYHCPP